MNETTPNLGEAQLRQVVHGLAWEDGGKKARQNHDPSPDAQTRIMETHISLVLLKGAWAYKFKKPVNFGFLDFSTEALRLHYCEEEIRLNRRTAPRLYVDVLEVRGSLKCPRFGGVGPLLTHAVRMRRFDPQQTLDRILDRGAPASRYVARHIDESASVIAAFHEAAAVAPPGNPWGDWRSVREPVEQNFRMLRDTLNASVQRKLELDDLQARVNRAGERRRPTFERRKQHGHIRECHGDLHLGNLALIHDRVTPFDALEFNPDLRWIDTASDLAFLVMDLAEKGREDLGRRLLSLYLEHGGDWGALDVLPYYQSYRAMVRAKVAALRWAQSGEGLEDLAAYARLAGSVLEPPRPALTITHGLSGSGKSSAAMAHVMDTGAVRIRSDVERKRLFPDSRDRYGRDADLRTYRHLLEIADRILDSGYPVVVDATFLARSQREPFLTLAEDKGITANILDLSAPIEVLRRRIRERQAHGQDASEATVEVMERQFAQAQPLLPEEKARIVQHRSNG